MTDAKQLWNATYDERAMVEVLNFTIVGDGALLSRADLSETIGLPVAEACRSILAAAFDELARAFPKTNHILTDPDFETAAKHCVGLDGRRIRKLVISACALRKSTALDPNNLTASDLVQATRQAQEQASSIQEERR